MIGKLYVISFRISRIHIFVLTVRAHDARRTRYSNSVMVTLNARQPARSRDGSLPREAADTQAAGDRTSGSYPLQVRVAHQVHINTDNGPGVNVGSQWTQVWDMSSSQSDTALIASSRMLRVKKNPLPLLGMWISCLGVRVGRLRAASWTLLWACDALSDQLVGRLGHIAPLCLSEIEWSNAWSFFNRLYACV